MENVVICVHTVLGRMAEAARVAGREPGEVRLVAVTKRVPVEKIREAYAAGITTIGESYVQEARSKREALADLPLEWRMIGRLQTNKAKQARLLFDVFETVDRMDIAAELLKTEAPGYESRTPGEHRGPVQALVQVRLGGAEGRSGVDPGELPRLLESLMRLEGIVLRGLMGVPALSEEAAEPRRSFAFLRALWDKGREQVGAPSTQAPWDALSMGMSGDYELAIQEGATSVRVGRAIFGERPAG